MLSPAEVRATVRADFYSFLIRCFTELHSGRTFSPAWHAEVLAAKLQGVGDGSVKRLVVNVPPRHLKSLAASVALPAWLLGHDPTLAIVNVTYAQDLSDKFARDCRAIMTSDWYQSLFATRLASAREPLAELTTSRGGFRLATSVGGVMTGRGADVILIDDPLKPADAMSQSRRAAANDWFDSTLYSRLNDKQKGAIVIVMQRLHEDDLAGHVLRQGGWDVVSFPAVAEEDEAHAIESPLAGARAFRRQAGEALDPAREPLSALERIRANIGEMNFAAQYQQRPAPAGGGMIKAAWLQRFRLAEPQNFDRIVQSWDTANKPSELADYSVCTTWGVQGPRFYLLNVLRKKLSYPELRRAVIEQERLFRPASIVIEDRASGTQLIQDLIGDGLSHVARFSPDGDKIMRLHAQSAVIENGFVFVPEEAPWLADYLAELPTFPAGRHDDQVELDRPGAGLGETTRVRNDGNHRLLGGARRQAAADAEEDEAEGAGRRLACPPALRRQSRRSLRPHPRTGRVRRQAAAVGARLGAGVKAGAACRRARRAVQAGMGSGGYTGNTRWITGITRSRPGKRGRKPEREILITSL